MKRMFILASLLAGCGVPAAPADPPPQPLPTLTPIPLAPVPSPVHLQVEGQDVALLLPPGWKDEGSYPLFVFDHGYSLDEYQVFQRTSFPRLVRQEGWILVSGSLGGDHWGNPAAIKHQDALIDFVLKNYRGDSTRIYLVGFSMGAGTALMSGIEGRWRPAAIAASQGWSDLSGLPEKYVPSILRAYGLNPVNTLKPLSARSPLAEVEKLRGIPLYLEHGRFDQEIPVKQCEQIHDRLESLAIPHSYRLFAGGHAESNLDAPGIVSFLKGKTFPLVQK